MKKFLLLILSITLFSSCQEDKDVKFIPLTTNSIEAKQAFIEGVFRNDQNEANESRESFRKALDFDNDFLLAKIYYNSDSPEENRSRLLEAYENRMTVSEIEQKIIESNYQRRIYNDLPGSIEIMDELLQKYNDIPFLFETTGYMKSFNKDFDDAIKYWNRALELNPNSYMSALALGLLNVTVGTDYMPLPEDRRDLEQGKEWLKLASKIRPDASATPRFLGNIYRAEGDLEEALSLYQTAVQKNTEKTSQIMEQRLMVAHTLSAMGDYDSAREWYEKTIEVSLNDFWWAQNHVYYSYTWLAQKRYDEAVKFLTQAQIEIEKMNLSTFVLNNILNRVEFNRWLILAHSQRKEESQQSLSLFNNRATKNFEQSLANAIDSKEIESLKRNHSSGVIYRNAWSDIIFGEYESASRNLEILKELQAPWIDKDPEAFNGYYELSGYLNLNQGNIENALDNYEKRKEMGDLGEYHDYFYALCLKATGDQEKSDQIMVSLANNPFVDWNTSIVRNLAKAQVQS